MNSLIELEYFHTCTHRTTAPSFVVAKIHHYFTGYIKHKYSYMELYIYIYI